MKPFTTHFQLSKEIISNLFNNNIPTSKARKWIIAVTTTVILMAGLEGPASAAGITYTWKGATGAAWTTPGNWTPSSGSSYPGTVATDIVVFSTNSSTINVTAVPSVTVASFTISGNTEKITLTPATTNSLTVSTTFTLGNSSTVILASGLTVIYGGTSFSNNGTVSGPGTIQLNGATNFGNFTSSNTGGGYINLLINGIAVNMNGSALTVNNLSIGISGGTTPTSSSLTIGNNDVVTVGGTFSNYGTTTHGLIGANPGGTITFAGSGQTFPQGAGSGGVINKSPNVIIANGTAVSLDATSVTVNNLTIGTSGATTSLNLNSSSNTITVGGTFTNNGTTNGLVGPGTIAFGANTSFPGSGVFSGATAPSVTLTNVNNLVVTNNANVTVNALSIAGSKVRLQLTSGVNLTVNGTFSNTGSSNGDGVVGANPGGTIIFNGTSQTFPVGGGSGGIFGKNPNVTVANGVTVTADAAVTINTLTINNSSSLFKDGGKVVTVIGNIVNNGAHTGAGSISLTSSGAERTLSGGGSYTNLTLNDANGAYLNSNATINGTLTLTSGILNPGFNGDTVFISSTGSVSRTNGWVYGFLAKNFATGSSVSKTFEVGDSTTSYRPVTVTFPSVSTPGYLIVSNTDATISPQPTTVAQDVPAYWTIINHVIAPSSASVTFNYLASDVIGSGTYKAQNYVFDPQNVNHGTWLSPWTTASFTGTSTTASAVTTFGNFVVGETGQAVLIRPAGPTTFCAGGSVALQSTLTQAGSYTYSWYVVPATSLGTTTANYTATTSGQYYLQVQNTSTLNYYYSDTITVTANPLPTANIASAPATICQGGTTAALGGSYGAGAYEALWSTSGTGTFANNLTGLTPGTATYTASSSDPSSVTLTLTAYSVLCGNAMASESLTVNPSPAPTVSFNSPAIICEGAPVVITNTTAGTYTYQWLLNGAPILGANSNSYSAASAGAYTLTLTNSATACTGTSTAVEVAELPQIPVDTIYIPANTTVTDTFVGLSLPTLSSYSVTPAGCNADMSLTGPYENAPPFYPVTTVVTTTIGVGGSGVYIVCNGGNVTVSGTGGNTFVVEDGGTLTGFGGGGGNTAFVKAGGTFNAVSTSPGGGNVVYYEPGAIITGGTGAYPNVVLGAYTVVACSNIGVIYPSGVPQLCTPYTYAWSTGGTNDTIDVTNQTDATYYVTVYQGSNLSNAKCTGSVVVYRLPYTWVGGNNGNDWSTPANWSPPGIPNACNSDVIIPINGNNPVVNSAVSVGNITVTGTGRELITLNSSLSVCHNWTDKNGATSSVSGSPVKLNGSSAQTLSGNLSFDQLAIANTSGGVSLASNATVGINTSLLLQTGNINTTAGTLTLNSASVTQAGIIDNFSGAASPGNGTITGSVTAQRFYGVANASNDFKQHMLGSPVSGINLSALGSANATSAFYQPYSWVVPGTPDPNNQCDELLGAVYSPYGNVFSYVESHASACTMAGWLIGAASTPVSAGTGYSVILGSGSSTLALTGTPNLNLSYSVPTTNSGYANTTSDQGRVYPSGINLVSNPYSATLNVSSLNTANSANFSSQTVYVWDVATGSYDMNPATIAPFQAFKVIQSAAGSSSYTIPASSRTTSAGTFQRTANPVELNMTITNNSTGLTDNTIVGFNPNSTAQFNQDYDVIKLPGALTRHTLYTLNNSYWLAINTLNSISETSTVGVGFEPGVSGTYTVSFSGLNSFDPTSYITLEDKQTGAMHDAMSGDYVFTSDANDNFNRFILHFTPPVVILTQDASCEQGGMINIQQPGTANWNYTVTDINNVTVASGMLNAGAPVSVSVNAGVYSLTLIDNAGYTVVKMVQVDGSQPVVAAFTANTSTAQASDNIVFTSTTANASTYSWDFGDGATGRGQQASHSYQSAGVYAVKLNVTDGGGCVSTTSQTITVTSRSATGIVNLPADNLNIWSFEKTVFVDFSKVNNVDAEVQLYNVLGQMLSDERVGKVALYSKNLTDLEVAYVIVKVTNGTQIVTKKVFIANAGK